MFNFKRLKLKCKLKKNTINSLVQILTFIQIFAHETWTYFLKIILRIFRINKLQHVTKTEIVHLKMANKLTNSKSAIDVLIY